MSEFKYLIAIYCFAFIIFPVHAKPRVLNIETNCYSYQFNRLENLIGSIHKYAPKNVSIFVRNMGLLKGQCMLLEQYQNVKILLPTNIIKERTQFIDVDKEFVFINGKYNIRPNNGKMLYADFIRKRYKLAVVIPFIRSQLPNVIVQLSMSRIYTPCRQSSQSVDLIFYHNEGEQSSLEKDIRKIKYINKCYQNIHYFAVNISVHDNWYPYGSFVMWHKLVLDDENNRLSLRSYGYTHLFLMEPDTRPIRKFWLDAIIKQITEGRNGEEYSSTKWWVSGSVYRGTKMIGDRFIHINGNALYHLAANFIQNCWHTGCKGSDEFNNTYFILNNRDTYLIHGGYVKENDGTTKMSWFPTMIHHSFLFLLFTS